MILLGFGFGDCRSKGYRTRFARTFGRPLT
jgi:hypothetical protein